MIDGGAWLAAGIYVLDTKYGETLNATDLLHLF